MNKQYVLYLMVGIGIGIVGTISGQNILDTHNSVQQPYAGQEKRQISSLSQQDVDDLLGGKGWGLAKPAELNGYPGPAHEIGRAHV